ncbi:MAG: NAD(P)/FAD-dependent oxidoreductase [Acholeplasmatales bacterium]|jgi:thioredoxin reductase (NADPH)|nr:NAD(P)/FAD-dependent oxidoreductase [Acholeplasmatales bacterium]
MPKIYDCVVLGIGPSGSTCATYLKRFNKEVLILSKDGGILSKSELFLDNLYGLSKISSKDLFSSNIKHLKELGIPFFYEELIDLETLENNIFKVITQSNEYLTKSIFLGLGINRTKPAFVKNDDLIGNGISFCASCDGFFYKNKTIGIYGDSEQAKHELSILENIASDILLFTKNKDLSNLKNNVRIINEPIVNLEVKDGLLNAVITKNNKYVLDCLFIADNFHSALTYKLGIEIDDNIIKVDNKKSTSVRGIYAGGDCIGPQYQIIKAACDGMEAAYSINEYLKYNDKK